MSGELRILGDMETRKMTRREVARRLFAGMAAGIALNSFSALDLVAAADVDRADETLGMGSAYKPAFFSAEQLATLERLCEAIVPGSHKAQSAEFLDLLISVETAERQQKFTAALSAMDAKAEASFQKKVVALQDAELRQILEKASAEQSPDNPHFETSKHWAVAAYYSSEIGMRELGWTPDRIFPSYPVCTHEERHS